MTTRPDEILLRDAFKTDRSWIMRVIRFVVFSGLGLGVAGAVAFAALYFGYRVGVYEIYPEHHLRRIDTAVEKFLEKSEPPEVLAVTRVESHLIGLDLDVGYVETGRSRTVQPIGQNGGGLTVFGDEILLLPYNGVIYAASSGSTVRPTQIAAPDNNRAAYIAAANDPQFAAFKFNPGYLRYNDLAHIEVAGQSWLVASYTEYHPDEACYTNTLARLPVDAAMRVDEIVAAASDWEVFYRSEPCLPFKKPYLAMEGHLAGGKLAFAAPSTLLMTAGDYHFDGMRAHNAPLQAQVPDSHYGKILAIDFATGDTEILSMGHRNPQGIARAPDGTIYTVEHGPKGGDELNIIERGANYGWPLESYGTTYQAGGQLPTSASFARHDSFTPPIFAWLPSIATSSLLHADGFHPAWDGDLLVASLIDQSIHRVRLQDKSAIYAERIPIGSRIRDMEFDTQGRLVLWTDAKELIFVSPRDRSSLEPAFNRYAKRAKLSSAMRDELSAAVSACAQCHSFDVGDHARAPGLARIWQDDIASTSYTGYSDALKARDGVWTAENLKAFLTDPDRFAPGAVMPRQELGSEALVDALVGFLADIETGF